MEMQSSRGRSLDSTRQAGLKKPRLTEEPQRDRPANTVIPASAGRSRPFPPRASSATVQLSDPRLRAGDREIEPRDDSSRGASYQQQMQELVAQYKTALAELTFNSKPIITNLTIIAGENLHAAKGIVATICTNILEVPSDQKLPSLYLLDSIVKNIGRDYIKYFALRLPEVFCKAYNQVDSSIHPGMRHLFGTWKGVFPSTTLQFIEKELGFSSATNGSSSVATSSRPDSQTQRPPHSIHVNPKYLEARQLLQPSTQSSQSKVISNNSVDSMEDAVEQPQRPGKTPSSGSMKQWIDPLSVKGIQRPLKDSIKEIVPKKNPGIYGDTEFAVDTSRKSDLKFGRDKVVSDQAGLDSTWYGLGSSISEASMNKKTGSNVSRTHEAYSSLRSSQAISQKLPLDQRITFKNDQVLSRNWKNSEEEEYMWDDMNSKLSDHGGSNLTRAGWDSDEMENPAGNQRVKFIQSHSNKSSTFPQWEKTRGEEIRAPPFRETEEYSRSDSQHDGRFRAKIEASSESLSSFGGCKNLSITHDQDHQVVTAFGHMNTISKNLGQFEEHQSPHVRESSKLISSVSAKDGVTPLSDISVTAYPSSLGPSLSTPLPQFISLQKPTTHGIITREYENTHLYSQTGPSTLSQANQGRPSKIPSDIFSKNSQSQTPQSQPSQNLQSSISDSPFITETPSASLSHLIEMRNHLPSHQQSRSDQSLQRTDLQPSQLSSEAQKQLGGPSLTTNSNNLEVNLGSTSSVSNLLAAFLQSGILSKDVTKVNSLPPLPSGPPPRAAVSSSSSDQSSFGSGTMSHVDILPPVVNTKSTIQPPLPLGPPPVLPHATDKSGTSQNPLSSLLSSLVAKGLISSTSDAQAKDNIQVGDQQPNQMESIFTSASRFASLIPDSTATSSSKMLSFPESPEAVKHEAAAPLKDLIGIEFKSEVIRGFHPIVINSLFDDLKHQCGTCGLRFQLSECLRKHLDWHNSNMAESRSLNQNSRKWFVDSNHWITGAVEALSEPEDNCLKASVSSSEKNEPMVPADERQSICALCGEPFEDYYSFSTDEWMYRGTIYLTKPTGKKETGNVDGHQTSDLIVHAKCYQQNTVDDLESA